MNTIISSDMYWVFLILRIFLRLFKMKQGSKWRTFCCAFICWTVSCSFGLIAYTQTVSLMGILKSIFKVGFAMNDLELATEFNDNSVSVISRLWVWCAFTHWIKKKVLIKVLWKDCFLFEEVITHFIMALSNSVCSSLALSQTHSM